MATERLPGQQNRKRNAFSPRSDLVPLRFLLQDESEADLIDAVVEIEEAHKRRASLEFISSKRRVQNS